ncbi:glycosyl transferase [Geomonas silvestris]|uniref:Glycosyl transferase n=1 Tax=Geomonas silvestris TaxID=2740184 RepID=A0A6V8MK59_9BACT|nr:glycosyltransferase family 4 protein [Geomonas silvestris]GFO60314.1 glycosyl transferase [Geomonas silvestris]
MKIAFFVVKNIERGGGIEKYTLELGRRLTARGHEVTLYSMAHYGDVVGKVHGMTVVKVPSIWHPALEKLSASAAAALHLVFIAPKYDIVHCHSVASGAFAPLLALRQKRCLLQMHGIEWQRSRWNFLGRSLLKLLETISLASNRYLTAVSQTQCDYYHDTRGVQMRYIPTGAEVKERVPAQEIFSLGLEAKRYILFASRLVPEKGAHYLISAFRRIATDYKLVIAGDVKGEGGYKETLNSLSGGDPRILFPGYVEGRLLEELFAHAAVYVQPSEIEGLSIALLEAMSYGNCCLVSDIPENREALADTGFTFRNKDIEHLKDQLEKILGFPEEDRESWGRLARTRVERHYSWDHVADEFEGYYRVVSH